MNNRHARTHTHTGYSETLFNYIYAISYIQCIQNRQHGLITIETTLYDDLIA